MPVAGLGPYDDTNIFARILRGELPCHKILENDWALAFSDINPQAPIHVLVIPKTRHVSLADFAATASPEQITGFFRTVAEVAKSLDLEQPGYRILANMGADAHQEVPHFHVHIFAGGPLGPMLTARGPGHPVAGQ